MTTTQNETDSPIFVKSFPVGPLQCNCTVIGNTETGEAIVVDPGGDADRILALLSENGLNTVKHILHTHAHFDHFLAAGQIHEKTGAPLALHPEDKILWENLEEQCGRWAIPFEAQPLPQHWLEHEEEINLTGISCKCLHTPGHTPGSTSFHFDDQKLLLAGDTLFRRAIGRTDLWGGDYEQIETSIKGTLYKLDEATHVVTGHGEPTSIGEEIRENQFIRG